MLPFFSMKLFVNLGISKLIAQGTFIVEFTLVRNTLHVHTYSHVCMYVTAFIYALNICTYMH